ncbi:GPP34 family phosphoprotein [Streptomyces sp. NPDC088757]|uniref:GPP34 family phosphoprotein n=1 Tax=Streptomyces sp. NPDC088757 TaxID=3365889 RepID=UPI0037F45664
MRLHEMFLLFVLGARGHRALRRHRRELAHGLAAAVLLDLERGGRIVLRRNEVFVRNAGPAEDRVGDAFLERLLLGERAPDPETCLRDAPDVVDDVVDQLLATGHVAWVSPPPRRPFRRPRLEPTACSPAARLHALVQDAAHTGGTTRDDIAVLTVLLGAARLIGPAAAPPHAGPASSALGVTAHALARRIAAEFTPLAFGG